ncbi:site-specific integrase [Aureispira sp. CCB-QB1]|uniref:site-specific integrase n=1 Tax=Aureispira sp. CCB-QB1 TaxID=1313421 RepID=UPI0006962323|nr:site-specific integrase [Aureispira sp. CCB-QB1]
MTSTANIVLNIHKKLKDGTHSVSLEIIKNGKRLTLKALKVKCTQKEWNQRKNLLKVDTNHTKTTYRNFEKANRYLKEVKERAEAILLDFHTNKTDFTKEMFLKAFLGKSDTNDKVFDFFEEIINEKKEGKQSFRTLVDTKNALFKFHPYKSLTFTQLDYKFLAKFEAHLRSRGNIGGGISVRMRSIRSIFNEAIRRNIALSKDYPFDTYKISNLKEEKPKVRLSLEEMKSFASFNAKEHPKLEVFHKLFLFSYYARGMNFIDMMLLRWEDISGERIYYKRSKTGKHFDIHINTKLQELLNFFKENYPIETGYIFPILLKKGLSNKQIEYRRKKVLTQYNAGLKKIANAVGIKKSLSSNVARHSFSSNLQINGYNAETIKEALGHKSVKYTRVYLDNFPKSQIDDMANSLAV